MPAQLWDKLMSAARTRFGVTELRPGQRELIQAVFDGVDAIGLMPPGSA